MNRSSDRFRLLFARVRTGRTIVAFTIPVISHDGIFFRPWPARNQSSLQSLSVCNLPASGRRSGEYPRANSGVDIRMWQKSITCGCYVESERDHGKRQSDFPKRHGASKVTALVRLPDKLASHIKTCQPLICVRFHVDANEAISICRQGRREGRDRSE